MSVSCQFSSGRVRFFCDSGSHQQRFICSKLTNKILDYCAGCVSKYTNIQQTFNCSKLTVETLAKVVKYLQS